MGAEAAKSPFPVPVREDRPRLIELTRHLPGALDAPAPTGASPVCPDLRPATLTLSIGECYGAALALSRRLSASPPRGRIGPDWRSREDLQDTGPPGTGCACKEAPRTHDHHGQRYGHQLKPLGSNVIVKPTPREETTKSGSSCPTPPRSVPRRARSWPSAPGARSTTASVKRSRSRSARRSSSRSTPARSSSWTTTSHPEARRHPGDHRVTTTPTMPSRPRRITEEDNENRGQAAAVRGRGASPSARRGQDGRRRQGHARAERPIRPARQEVRGADHHERRRHHRPRHRARGPLREHGCPAARGSRGQDERRRR